MDFRTEWSSWLLVILMMIISYLINPWVIDTGIVNSLMQIVGVPIAAIAIACIPVLIVCYFIKVIPDIDYSIRVAFVYMVIMLIKHFIN